MRLVIMKAWLRREALTILFIILSLPLFAYLGWMALEAPQLIPAAIVGALWTWFVMRVERRKR